MLHVWSEQLMDEKRREMDVLTEMGGAGHEAAVMEQT